MGAYAKVKAWRRLNPAKVTAQAARRRKKYPQKTRAASVRWRAKQDSVKLRAHEAEYARNRRKADPEGQRRRNKAFKERREAELVKIAGRSRPDVCELCKRVGHAHKLHGGCKTVFDHCHHTGRFRGWICDRCNKVLGLVGDDPDLLVAMVEYLEKDCGCTSCEDTQRDP